MKNKLFFLIAGVTALLAISCNKETTEVASSKANAKTEEVSFSVGISQEDTKAYFERTGAKEWTAKFDNNDKILVKATDDSGTILSIAEFTGGNKNVFNGIWTYPEEGAKYSFFYPSSLGNGILDLRRQNPYVITYGKSDPGKYYALRGDVGDVKAGEFPESISLKPLVAMLQVFPVGELNLVAKDAKGAFVTGIDSEGKIISSSEISQEEAVLFSTRDLKTSGNPGVVMIAVPAGEKLTFYNGDKELKTTRDSGLNAGSVVSLSGSGVGLDVKIELSPDVEVTLNSATVKGRIKVEGIEPTHYSIELQLGYDFYQQVTAKQFLNYHRWSYMISGSSITLDENGYFTVTIPELRESTTYYYIVRAIVNPTSCYQYDYFSETMSFTTLEPQITVETRAPRFVGFNEAELDSYVITSTSEGPGTSFKYSSTASTREELIASGKGCFSKLTGLEKGTTYYYIAVGTAGKRTPYKIAYGDVMSFTTLSSEAEVGEAVDLGLSVKWRSCNLGASLPLTLGDTYSWGETSEPLSGEKYNKYKGGGGKEVLDLEDDTAHYILGGKWRMPTYADIEEMKSKCTLTAITYYSSDGTPPHFIIRSNVPGYTGKYITIPVSNDIWTSTLIPFETYSRAYVCHFLDYPTGVNIVPVSRQDKRYIRPVCEK